jgi:hypothetical protein
MAQGGLFENLHLFAVNRQAVFKNSTTPLKNRRSIILVNGHGLGVTDVVECNDIQFIWIHIADCFEHLATNASKPINTNFDCHIKPPGLICDEDNKSILSQTTRHEIVTKVISVQWSRVFIEDSHEGFGQFIRIMPPGLAFIAEVCAVGAHIAH